MRCHYPLVSRPPSGTRKFGVNPDVSWKNLRKMKCLRDGEFLSVYTSLTNLRLFTSEYFAHAQLHPPFYSGG